MCSFDFRGDYIAFIADIEAMFYQVRIPPEQRSYLRFLWWKDIETKDEIADFEMCAHVFGGTSSPSCSNYALKRTAVDNEDKFGEAASNTLKKNFYVDDLLKSLPTVEDTINLVSDVIKMCAAGGFNLTKFTSNSKEVLKTIPEERRKKGVKNQDLVSGDIPEEKALGVHWNVEEDVLGFQIELKEKPLTRRGLLSTLSSVYDPLGIVAPFILEGRSIIQKLCKGKFKWDETIPEDLKYEWIKWKNKLIDLENIKIARCYKPEGFGEVIDCSLHHFSDASQDGYGQASYLRLVNSHGKIHCTLLIGKSRVAPIKYISIPRLELTAATLSVKVSRLLKRELDAEFTTHMKEYYWTDSQVVLGYIRNDARKFKIFVANRVQLIRDQSDIDQWKYVSTAENPADYASRGLDVKQKHKVKIWFNGPDFLWKTENSWPSQDLQPILNKDDPDVKTLVSVNSVKYSNNVLTRLEKVTSSWDKMKRILAVVLLFIRKLKSKLQNESLNINSDIGINISDCMSVQLMEEAQTQILRMVQQRSFSEEIKMLQSTDTGESRIPKSSTVYKLDPFIDQYGLLRVGGRLKKSFLDVNLKHPNFTPKERCDH